MIYFTSDQHFGDQDILRHAKRPFSDSRSGMTDCAKVMYELYQDTVSDKDVVVFLGDVALVNGRNRDVFRELLCSLKGTKILVLGNHDKMDRQYYRDCGFTDIRDYFVVQRHFVCHYPCVSDGTPKERLCKAAFENSNCTEIWHGHLHEKESPASDGVKRHNMCVDYVPNRLRPVLVTEPELTDFFEKFRRFR